MKSVKRSMRSAWKLAMWCAYSSALCALSSSRCACSSSSSASLSGVGGCSRRMRSAKMMRSMGRLLYLVSEAFVIGLCTMCLPCAGCFGGLLLLLNQLLAAAKRTTLTDVESVWQGPESFIYFHGCVLPRLKLVFAWRWLGRCTWGVPVCSALRLLPVHVRWPPLGWSPTCRC